MVVFGVDKHRRIAENSYVMFSHYSNRMYNKLFTKILDSSIWLENQPTRIVWITFIACMDQDGVVALSGIGNVANRARVSEQEAEEAIRCLESPDVHNPDQDHEGRRIERIPGVGWLVINAGKYRDIIKAETARAQNRERVRRHRKKQNVVNCNGVVMDANENVTPSEAEAEATPKAGDVSDGNRRPQTMTPVDPSAHETLGVWLAALAPLLGAKSVGTMPKRRTWEQVCMAAIQEQRDLVKFLDIIKSERHRNKDALQFFSPDTCLQKLQMNGTASTNGAKPQWQIDRENCQKCDERGYVEINGMFEACDHK